MIGNLGFPEIMIILVIVLLLFGAKRIPEIAGRAHVELLNPVVAEE